MERPVAVSTASWIWLFAALFTSFTIMNIVAATGFLAFATGLVAEEDEIGAVAVIGTAGAILAVVLFVGMVCQVISAVKFRDGARWTRIVLVVVTVLSLLAVVFDVTAISAWGVLAANIVAAVLAFGPQASAYLAGPRRSTAAAA